MDKSKFKDAFKIFERALDKFPNNQEPYLLQVLCLIKQCPGSSTNGMINIDSEEKLLMISRSIEILNTAIKASPDRLSLFYFRGLLYYYKHQFFDALLDLDYIVEKDDEPHAHYYLARGRCYACLSMFPEAVKDLTASLTLDEECLEAFLNRGKCAYLLGNTPLAFLDF